MFIDLRDRTGIVQLAFNDGTQREIFESRCCPGGVCADGQGLVRRRESVNTEIPTGEVEVYVDDLRVLAKSQTPPFEIVNDTNVKEGCG